MVKLQSSTSIELAQELVNRRSTGPAKRSAPANRTASKRTPVRTTTKTTTKQTRITRRMIEEYLQLQDQRLELQRRITDLEKQSAKTGDALMKLAMTGRGKPVPICGYEVQVVDGRRFPAWKQEYIAVAGEDAAEAVINRTKPSKKLEVAQVD